MYGFYNFSESNNMVHSTFVADFEALLKDELAEGNTI
jgi:hypothetical protein